MAKPKQILRLDSVTALKAISSLEKQAKQTSTDAVKKVLLSAGCEIADLVLKSSQAGREAA